MKKPNLINVSQALVLLRITVALLLIAHAVVRWAGGTIDRFAGFLDSKGFIYSTAIVWALTVFEIVGGVLMAFGFFTRWLALLFILQIGLGIILIHAANGWFVGEHGIGGMEYSVLLIICLLVIAVSDKK